MRQRIGAHGERLRWLTGRAALASPAARLTQQAQRLDELEQCLLRALRRRLSTARERLHWLTGRATLVSPSARLTQQALRLENLQQRLGRAWRQVYDARRAALSGNQSRLWRASPIGHVRHTAARHAALFARLQAAELSQLRRSRERLLPLVRTLNAVSPLATLERGYAIVSTEAGRILRDAADAPPDTIIEARLSVGRVRARVERP
jgi:exodeoxyribonuclease VII large subunit